MPSDQRLHPLSVLFSFLTQLKGFAIPGILLLVGAGSAGWLGWQMWTALFLIPQALVSIARYVSFRYRYDENEMVIRSGVLFRNERHIPYRRIQNLDAVQNVLHRLFGVVEVRLETGGGDEPEAKMSVLPLAAFEEMRRRVFAEKSGAGEPADAAAAVAELPAGRTLLHLPPRELMLYGLIENRGVVLLAAAFGLVWELEFLSGGFDRVFGRIFGEQTSGRGLVRSIASALLGQGGLPVGRIALALGAFVLLLLALRLFSMAWALVRLYGFRLTLAGEDLRTELGLLTRVTTTIPLRRIQTLTIREGPLHQLCRRASVRVDTAGGSGGEEGEGAKQREWLAPILRRAELPGLLREVLPELDLAAVTWNPAAPRAFRRELKTSLLVAVAVALPFVLLLKWWDLALLAVLVAWAVAAARLHVAHLGWAVTGSAVLFRSGWLWKQVSIARFAKIQAVALHESPFDRRTAMARVRVDTAGAGDLSHRVDIPYLARETAQDLYNLLALQAARTAFRW